MTDLSNLIQEHHSLLAKFLACRTHMKIDTFNVLIDGETISIPNRLYVDFAQPQKCTDTQKLVWSCLYSRMSDGFVRERFLKEIIFTNSPYVVPYVIQFCGEYVLEIIDIIHSNRNKLDHSMYQDFIMANPEFIFKTKQRAASYWNCTFQHERTSYESRRAFEVIEYFESSA
jgi:hypothetical protein